MKKVQWVTYETADPIADFMRIKEWIYTGKEPKMPGGPSTSTEREQFGQEFLDDIQDWIAGNIDAEDLYGEDEIKEWIRGYYEPSVIYEVGECLQAAFDKGTPAELIEFAKEVQERYQ